jgi:RHS repeat-associated protein
MFAKPCFSKTAQNRKFSFSTDKMKIPLTAVVALAVWLVGSISTNAQTGDTTQQILRMRTFREGLVLIGDREPGDGENRELLEVLNHLAETGWTVRLEQFLEKCPQSPWAASLHYDYASFCRRTGRTTKALEQFESAWELVKNDTTLQGRRLGGAILGNWADLLSSLGRVEELKELIAEGDLWHFGNPRDRNKFQGAKNSYYLMQKHPQMAYRCGTFALKAVGEKLQSASGSLEKLVEEPSPTNGFSMAALADLAKKYGLNLVPVRRTRGRDLVVPSVVHWRQNHYAAILGKQDDLYLVNDPTFGGTKLLPAEAVNEEASGEFLVPATSLTNGWTRLAADETAKIHGMGLPNNIDDGNDKSCGRSFNGQTSCTHCAGMPVWWVSEPYINLWLSDQPISYLTSRGQPFTFQLTYKQRDTRIATFISTAGWNNSWQSYIHLESTIPGSILTFAGSDISLYLANGGEVDLPQAPGATRYDPETRLMIVQQASLLTGGVNDGDHGLRVVHADGSQDIYALWNSGTVAGDYPYADFAITRHIDPNGDTAWFQYETLGDNEPQVLTSVVDPDGRTNFLSYNTSTSLLLSVTNAYGQNAQFKYDGNGNLTNIVDAQGLSSSIVYNTNGDPTSLTTLYGTTTFSVFANSTVASTNDTEGNFGGDDLIDRAVQVTDPVGANYLYMYRYDCSSASPVDMSPTFSSSDVPTNTPLGTLDDGDGSTNKLAGVCYRNSFYWGPRQFDGLSTNVYTNFVANDYQRGRMQHWLEDTNQLYLTSYLSVKRDPSPDGTTQGLLTFYDYQGKLTGYNYCAGSYPLPSVQAWRLPNGETHYEYLLFDYFGNIANDITTYTPPGGGWGTRTNQFTYAGNTYSYLVGTWNGTTFVDTASATNFTVPNLLSRVIGTDGNTLWSYGAFDTVTWTNFYPNGPATNGSVMTLQRVLPDHATNGLGQVTTVTYVRAGTPVNYYNAGTLAAITYSGNNKITSATTAAGLTTTNIYNTGGFLTQKIDLQIGRTNSFGYTTDGLIGAFTNELGLNVSATWDNLLRLTSVQFPDGTLVSNLYNKLDLGGKRDRLGNWTYYGYDGARHLIAVTNANNAVWLLTWCGCGVLTDIKDPLNHTNTLNYDNAGDLTNENYPDGSALNWQYNLAGWPTNLSDGSGRLLQLGYDNQGVRTTASNVAGQVYATVYDIRDRPTIMTDANAVTVTNSYDVMSELLTQTYTEGVSDRFGYAASGLVAWTNQDNQVTLYGRDAAGRLVSMTNASHEVVDIGYNSASERTSLIDGLSHTTTWGFNQYGWLIGKTNTLGATTIQYSYDSDGHVTNRWMAGTNTGYTYDAVGNLKTINYPATTVSFSYDAVNDLTNMADQVGTTGFTWTQTGQLASETDPWTSAALTYGYTQGYRTSLILTQPSGSWSQTYGYDGAWRTTNITSPAGTFDYSYPSGLNQYQVSSISLPNGASIQNQYDGLGRLTSTALQNFWGHALDGYVYGLDGLGLRTNITRQLGLATNTVSVSYDPIGEVASWIGKEANGTLRQNEQLEYTYDAGNNLNGRTNNALVQTFAVNSLNQLGSVTRNTTFTLTGALPGPANSVTVNGSTAQVYGDFTFANTNNTTLTNGNNTFTIVAENVYGLLVTNSMTVNLPGTVSPQYDNNGNLTNDGTRVFTFDAENRLTNVTVSGQYQISFTYDGFSRLRIITNYAWESTWVVTNVTRYIFDGIQVLQDRNTNNSPVVTYTRGLDLSGSLQGAGGIGGLLARTDANGPTYYHADGNGNITALTDTNANIVARNEYDGFGRRLAQNGSMAGVNEMGFSSFPTVLGIVLSPGRPYFTELQRWGSRDPIGEYGGINLYTYAGNNPVGFVDPYGLAPWYSWLNPFSYSSGYAQYQGQQALQSQLNANGYGSSQEFQLANPTWNGNGNGTLTAGDTQASQAAASVAADAANLYLTAATAVTPTAAGMNVGLDALSQAASALDRGGFTKAGRSLTKHCVGARPGNALFPAVSGDAAAINKQAQAIVDGILTDPGTVFQNSYRGRFGNTLEATAPNGQGVVFDANGNFLFFKE